MVFQGEETHVQVPELDGTWRDRRLVVCREGVGKTKRGNPLATIKMSVQILHPFFLLIPAAVAFEGQREIVHIVLSFLLCSSRSAAGDWGGREP